MKKEKLEVTLIIFSLLTNPFIKYLALFYLEKVFHRGYQNYHQAQVQNAF